MKSGNTIWIAAALLALSACGSSGSPDTTTLDAGGDGTIAPVGTTTTSTARETDEAAVPDSREDDSSGSDSIGSTTTATRPPTEPPATTIPEVQERDSVTGEVPEQFMEMVFAAAESTTGKARSAMTVLRAEAVTWSDGSLGCPEPGISYTQALVDGYWVELGLTGTTLDYRLSVQGEVRLCEAGGVIPRNDG